METTELQQAYDRFAATYSANRGLFDVTEIFDAFYARLQKRDGHVLDLGCGAGEPFARWFADHGWRVTGVDLSAQMLRLAARYVPEMKTIHGDMRTVRFEPGSFDAVIAVYSFFHVPRSDQPQLLENFRRWLRPGGRALFTYATQEYTGSAAFEGTKEFMGERLFYSHTTPEELFSVLKKKSFEVESADYREIGGETFLWVTALKL